MPTREVYNRWTKIQRDIYHAQLLDLLTTVLQIDQLRHFSNGWISLWGPGRVVDGVYSFDYVQVSRAGRDYLDPRRLVDRLVCAGFPRRDR